MQQQDFTASIVIVAQLKQQAGRSVTELFLLSKKGLRSSTLACSFIVQQRLPMFLYDLARSRLLRTLLLSLGLHALLLLETSSELPMRLTLPTVTLKAIVSAGDIKKPKAAAPPQSFAQPSASDFMSQSTMPSTTHRIAAQDASAGLPDQTVPTKTRSDTQVAADSAVRAMTGAPASSNDGVNADDLRQYRLSLAIAARRFKHYPAQAKERAWEGTVEVALQVSSLVAAPEVSLVSSSGQDILDEQAIEMITQAARSTNLPERLQGRDFRLLLPVEFSLR